MSEAHRCPKCRQTYLMSDGHECSFAPSAPKEFSALNAPPAKMAISSARIVSSAHRDPSLCDAGPSPKFDKKAYQRDYMKTKYRPREKARKAERKAGSKPEPTAS